MGLPGRTLLERYARWVVAGFLIAIPFLIYTAFGAVQNKTNKVGDWLPETYAETDELKWFRKQFVGDQFVVVSWEGCRLGDNPNLENPEPDDPRIEQLARLLVPTNADTQDRIGDGTLQNSAQPIDTSASAENSYFKSVTTARRLLNRLTSGNTNLRYDAAVNRLKGALIGPDSHQTCLVVTLSDAAIDKFRQAIGRGSEGWLRFRHTEGELFKALRKCGIPPDEVHLGGPPVDSVAIDEEGERTLYRLASLAALVGMLLAWWSLRSFRLTLIVFACGVMSAVASLSAVWLTGGTTDAFLLSMPSLVYVLAVSGAVHLIKYYRDSVAEDGLEGAPAQAIILGWKPTLLCSVTTAIGLLALCTSDLTPIRKFGMYSSFGVMLMLVTLFVFLPAALYVWPIKRPRKFAGLDLDHGVINKKWKLISLDEFWQRFGRWVIQRYVSISIACTTLIVVVGVGVTQVRTNIDLMKLFDGNARIRQDYQWLESNVGRLVPMEVVLKFDQNTLRREDGTPLDQSRLTLLERIETVAAVRNAIDQTFGPRGKDVTGRSISPVTFVPPLPGDRGDARSRMRRSAVNSTLRKSYRSLSDSGYLTVDKQDGSELWRISVRVAAFKDVDYGEFADQIRGLVNPLIEQRNAALINALYDDADADDSRPSPPALSAVYTGVIPIVYKAQRALLDSLMESTFWSFTTITPLLMFVSRGVWSGAVAMLPNCLPVLVVFGGMGWLGVPVTIGSMMSASIALGVAVDDTIHYLMWFRFGLDKTGDRRAASLTAYRRCATPTLQAAMISGLGLSVFAFSTFAPTKHFGLLMLTILIAGVVAELVMIPALLAGPLGRAFQPHNKPLPVAESETPSDKSAPGPTR
jgi:predicted RND superfamily exporter protein